MVSIPIYLCDVVVLKFKDKNSKIPIKETLLKSLVVKGFTLSEIKTKKRILENYKKVDKIKSDEVVEVRRIILKKQLGYGVAE